MTTIKLQDGTEALNLAEVKAHLRVDHNDEDALIELYISAARETAEARTGRAITVNTYRMALDCFPDSAIELDYPKLISVQSVKYFDEAGVQQTINSADYVLDTVSQPGWVNPAPGLTWPKTQEDRINAVEIEYTAGYTVVPKPLKVWMLLAITDLYERRGRSSERPAVPQEFADSYLDPFKIWML